MGAGEHAVASGAVAVKLVVVTLLSNAPPRHAATLKEASSNAQMGSGI